ncbi:SpaH/EbpB family LPXTG-anchored major pilin [Psychromicrobium xiongbiense]|uniref:SpaH/EbpB family LPXTG-anchored major pilin n=1 Tax=Psychromicrobium xiongbiense TaxID=3051184 RepID=UPI002552B138|nr:SpaH/EbpB family LPXTG-anchored major pilin [Psychromicrobium sp. YIM S02556]
MGLWKCFGLIRRVARPQPQGPAPEYATATSDHLYHARHLGRGKRPATVARHTWATRFLSALLIAVAAVATPLAVTGAAAVTAVPGSSVYIGSSVGYGGTSAEAIYLNGTGQGTPDYYAYCIEHNVGLVRSVVGTVGSASTFLGTNYFTNNPTVQGKVLWVLAHSYPAMSLASFGVAAGVPNISLNDAIEATQYAIWRYTDLNWDTAWNWSSTNSQTAYWYLVNGANASTGLTPADLTVTASITGPTGAQTSGSLIGPFVVHTNQPTASVSANPVYTFVDAAGNPINANAVVDGQVIYLDLRGSIAAGSVTVTISAQGASGTGLVISAPKTAGGTPTAGSHGQSLILVAPSTATTTDSASASWAAVPQPTIGTTLVDAADGDHTLIWSGGTLNDSVAYQNLVPGTQYTLSGLLMDKATGTSTGLTGSTTFTPTSASGTVTVNFTVPSGFAGHALVAFESLYKGTNTTGTAIAVHSNINDAAQTVTVDAAQPTLQFAKTSNPVAGTAVKAGDTITYTVTATNPSTTVSSTAGALTDDLTNVLSKATLITPPVLSCSPAANACGTLSYVMGASIIAWTSNSAKPLAPATTATITYTVTVKSGVTGSLKNVLTEPGITVEHPIITWNTVAIGPVKNMVNQPTNGAALGSVIDYQVTQLIPALATGQTYQKFMVNDTLDAKLTPVTALPTITVNDATNTTVTFTSGTDFTPVWNGQKLTVTFTAAGLAKLVAGHNVVVGFKATANAIGAINNQAFVNLNDYTLTPGQSNTPDGSPTNTVQTRWGGVTLKKVDARMPNENLSGAQFTAWMGTTDQSGACVASNGTTGFTQVTAPGTSNPYIVTSDINGSIVIPGLWVGDTQLQVNPDGSVQNVTVAGHDFQQRCYLLQELVAPAGYVLPTGNAALTPLMVKTGANGSVTSPYAQIPNTQQSVPQLPLTGGDGLVLLTTAGIGLMILAAGGSLVVAARRRRREEVDAA